MTSLTPVPVLNKWEKSRSQTFVIFCILAVVSGFEWGIIIPTLYHYLTADIQAQNADIWFGSTVAGFFAMSIIGNLTITKYADTTRNIRRSIIFVCILVALGNFLYAIPYSPVFPLIGRSLQGLGDSLVSVLNGEIIRVFPEDLVLKKVSAFITTIYMAISIGPVSVIFFQGVRVNFLSIPLGPSNLPNIIIGFLWLLTLILTIVFVSDLSKMYDLKHEQTMVSAKEDVKHNNKNQQANDSTKEDTKHNNKNQQANDSLLNNVTSTKNKQHILPLKVLLANRIFLLLLALNVICSYAATVNASITMPIIAEKMYGLSTSYVAGVYSSAAISLSITVFLISKTDHYRKEIYLVITGLCTCIIGFQLMNLSIIFNHLRTFGIVCLFCYSMTQGCSWSVEQVLLSVILAQLIPSSSQSYAEGVRRAISSICYMASGLVGAVIQPYIIQHNFVLAILMFIFAGYFLKIRKKFFEIRVIEHSNEQFVSKYRVSVQDKNSTT